MRLIARSRGKAQNKGLWGAECLGVNVFRVSHISWCRRCHLDEWYFLSIVSNYSSQVAMFSGTLKHFEVFFRCCMELYKHRSGLRSYQRVPLEVIRSGYPFHIPLFRLMICVLSDHLLWTSAYGQQVNP
jgi:hypothetical protein